VRRFAWIAVVTSFFSMCGLPAFAQFSSGIEGTVQDKGGSAVAGAQVTITDTRLGVSRSIQTNQSGYFRVDRIAASTYTVEVSQTGFESWKEPSLTLQVGEVRTLTPVLSIGSVSTSVNVSAEQVALNLSTPTTGSVIERQTVQQTPLPGQVVFSLASLAPGVTGNAVTSGDNYTNEYAVNINAAGQRQENNSYIIDGAFTNNPSRAGGTSISPNPEIVQSVDIRTNDFDAEKGRTSGASVQVFTNSGSNTPHGTVNYYFLNDSLTARTEFQTAVPAYTRNQAGATFGGPILKNKLFAYGGIDVLRSSSASAYLATVETQELANYVEANFPNTVAAGILKAAPPQHYPTSNIQTVSGVETSNPGYYPAPNIPGTLPAVGTANINYSVPRNGVQWNFRVDSYLGQGDRIYVTALRTSLNTVNLVARPTLNTGHTEAADFINSNWTHTFSARLLNETGAYLVRPQGANQPTPGFAIPYINVTGLQNFTNWGAGNFIQNTVGWRDVLTATVGSHELKFGGDIVNTRENDQQSSAFNRPTYNFNSLLDFVQDLPTSETATPINLTTLKPAGYERRYRNLYTGAFVQDNWKVRPTFTLNLGVRYDSLGHLVKLISPQLSLFTLAQGPTLNAQIANGVIGPPVNKSANALDHNIWQLTPRVGFSWDVGGKGRTAIRGGFGLFANQPPYIHITDITAGNLPFIYSPSFSVYSGQSTPAFSLCDPPQGYNQACPLRIPSNITFDSRGGIVGQRAGIGGFSRNYKLGQAENWTLSLQQQLQSNLVFELNYSASAAHHLPVFQDINRFDGDLIVNGGTLKRLNPSFGSINYGSTDGNSIGQYGSVLLSRRSTNGLTLRGIYTWGKSLDVYSTSQSLDSGSVTTVTNIIQSQNYAAQRGRADFDIRQQFSADGTWLLPSPWKSGWKSQTLGGWQVAGVWIVQTGLPFTVYTTAPYPIGDYNADGYNYDVPNTPHFGNHLKGQPRRAFLHGLFAASDFPVPPLGQEGNVGRNTYDQPGYNNVDFTVEKIFHTPWFFGEKLNLEGRGEVFNLFNRPNLLGVTSDMSSALFGHSTNQLPARSVQLHVRANF
jgi:hypothetical protein